MDLFKILEDGVNKLSKLLSKKKVDIYYKNINKDYLIPKYEREKEELKRSKKFNKFLSHSWGNINILLIVFILLVSAFNLWVSFLTTDLHIFNLVITSKNAGPYSTILAFIFANLYTSLNPRYRFYYRNKIFKLQRNALREIDFFKDEDYTDDRESRIRLLGNSQKVEELSKELDNKIENINKDIFE